ncbi:unnamed protein product [Cochlearia groenlandica]
MEPKCNKDLPVGFRFRPTDCEISTYFLKRKVLGQPLKAHTIPQECNDIFSKHPRYLPGYPREEHWYFYCIKLEKQVTTNSHDSNILWTQIGEETNVMDPNDALVGIKRSFTLFEHAEESSDMCFFDEEEEEEAPQYNWYMDEISLPLIVADTDLVVCHVFGEKIEHEYVGLDILESESEEEESVVGESIDIIREKDETILPPSPSPPYN